MVDFTASALIGVVDVFIVMIFMICLDFPYRVALALGGSALWFAVELLILANFFRTNIFGRPLNCY